MMATSLALPYFFVAMPIRFVLVLAIVIMPFALVPVPALSRPDVPENTVFVAVREDVLAVRSRLSAGCHVCFQG